MEGLLSLKVEEDREGKIFFPEFFFFNLSGRKISPTPNERDFRQRSTAPKMDSGFRELLIDSRPFKLLDNAFLIFSLSKEKKRKIKERIRIFLPSGFFSSSFRFDVRSIIYLYFSPDLPVLGIFFFFFAGFSLCPRLFFSLLFIPFFILLTQLEKLFDFQYLNHIALNFF